MASLNLMVIPPAERVHVQPNKLLWFPLEVRLRIYEDLCDSSRPLAFVINAYGHPKLPRFNRGGLDTLPLEERTNMKDILRPEDESSDDDTPLAMTPVQYRRLRHAREAKERRRAAYSPEKPRHHAKRLPFNLLSTCRILRHELWAFIYTFTPVALPPRSLSNLQASHRVRPHTQLISHLRIHRTRSFTPPYESIPWHYLNSALPELRLVTISTPGNIIGPVLEVLDLIRHLPLPSLHPNHAAPPLTLELRVPRSESAMECYNIRRRTDPIQATRGTPQTTSGLSLGTHSDLVSPVMVDGVLHSSDRRTRQTTTSIPSGWMKALEDHLPPFESATGLGRNLRPDIEIRVQGSAHEDLLSMVNSLQRPDWNCAFVKISHASIGEGVLDEDGFERVLFEWKNLSQDDSVPTVSELSNEDEKRAAQWCHQVAARELEPSWVELMKMEGMNV